MLAGIAAAVSGYRTYIIAAMVILIALTEGVLGIDIPGADVGDDALTYALNGLGLGTLRAGVAKIALNALIRM